MNAELPSEAAAGFPERLAVRAIQIGAVVVVLVASTLTVFDLDRFFVPKDIALHATAFAAGVLSFRALRKTATTRADLYLVGCLALGALSAAFATNHWLGLRALAVSASGVALFWSARGLRRA